MLAYLDPGTGFVVVSLGDWLLGLLAGGAVGLAVGLRRRWPAILLATVLLGGLAWLWWSRTPMPSPFPHRLVILGFDGMSPDLAERWKADLPHLSGLHFRPLATTNPPQSPVAWSTFATGLHPENHGIFDFLERDPATYRLSLTPTRFDARGRPRAPLAAPKFWQRLGEAGVPSTILFCPITFPPDRFDGRMMSGMGVPDAMGTEGTFSYFTSDPEELRSVNGGVVRPLGTGSTSVLELPGPRVADWRGRVRQATRPVQVSRLASGLRFTWDEGSVELRPGVWSDWQPVSFEVGWWRKMHGIVRFLVLETSPQVKVYASPVQYDPRQPWTPVSHPASYAAELADEMGLFSTLGMPNDTWAANEEVLSEEQHLEQTGLVWEERVRIFRRELSVSRPGVLMAYFEATDTVSHMFWRRPEVIRSYYERCDALVGEVLAALGPEDTLIVLSDHGFTDFRRAAHLNSWLRKNGYLALKEDRVEGRPMFADVDWSRTRAYAVGFNGLCLNLKGREGQGIVTEREPLLAEIAAGLEGWRDGSERVVERAVAGGPDLLVGYRPGYRASWQTAMGGAPLTLVEDNTLRWSGDHLVDPSFVPGVLFTSRPVSREDPGLEDLAPTILRTVGVPAEGMDGEPLW